MNRERSVPSMAGRISRHWTAKMFSLFLGLNIFLLILFVVGTVIYINIESDTQTGIWLSEPPAVMPESTNTSVINKAILRSSPANQTHYIHFDSSSGNIMERAKTVIIEIADEDTGYRKYLPIGNAVFLFLCLGLVLIIWETFKLFGSIIRGGQQARKMLAPIAEFTKTAEKSQAHEAAVSARANANARTNTREDRARPIATQNLTGTLLSIDEKQLDKRISLESCPVELRDLASAINDMLDRLKRAYEQQVQFVSDASHELRTPLSVIQGYANLLDRWGKEDETTLQESVIAIIEEAEHMKKLVEYLLFLARGDRRNIPFTPIDLDIGHLLNECHKDAELIDENHKWEIYAEENIIISADLHLIKQALWVIIDNAIKYTPQGEVISLKIQKSDGRVGVVVQDNGVGMDEDELSRMFDRFYRADNSRTHKTFGYGLGLSIYKMITDAHGAVTEVISRPTLGTKITVWFPCGQKEDQY